MPGNGHGGARPGAGRPKRTLRYASEAAAAERSIMATLPRVIELLRAAAELGDVAAMKYLCDRALGRMDGTRPPIAERMTEDDNAPP